MSPGRYEVEAPCTFPGETALDVAHELPEQETYHVNSPQHLTCMMARETPLS